MKCPYRTITDTQKCGNREITTTDFEECYGTECPFYVPEKRYSYNIFTAEYCGRAVEEKD